jgi:drug/metabolite transporter (DMT)-like permease
LSIFLAAIQRGSTAMNIHDTTRGMAAMIASMGLFVLNDAAMKIATVDVPVAEAVMLRGALAAPLIAAVIWARREQRFLRCLCAPVIVLRAGFDAANAMMFLTALTMMTLADDVAIQQIVPLLMIVYAAVFLREKIGGLNMLTICIGLGGALLIASPSGEGLGMEAVLAFGAALAVAGRDLTTRHIDKAIPSLVLTLTATIVLTLGAAAFAVFGAWVTPGVQSLLLLALSAVLITAALVAVTEAFRLGEVQAIAPLYYMQTVFALIATYVIFGVVPASPALAGMALVVAAGLFVMLRPQEERRAASLGALKIRLQRRDQQRAPHPPIQTIREDAG